MSNIITFGMNRIFNLEKILQKKEKKKKVVVVAQKYRNIGLRDFITYTK
jgi:hypothetical protein